MNENIDLTKILKNCPKGTELWSDNYGYVKFMKVGKEWDDHPIEVEIANGLLAHYTEEGWWQKNFPANCLLWPSRDCRDWSNFSAPWYKKDKFDPKTLNVYDKVLVSDTDGGRWNINIFSHIVNGAYPYRCIVEFYKRCIPYNEETKHLVGTKEKAPEYYRYWEDGV